ncbi:hypothetical protein M422DRAFT_270028 [Sphaerobolus stellatus SS14]|uniref:Oxidoreductase-like domain-containing protein n=1 Tax=Sphaerobolus stellatus (strain SS14) TaxID=990650 RepID=A0A0C9UI54_SPHS4|nr:hypothetical protein M422DRAFT_270028 [Sphaerobolus stellatus SS14]
MSMKTLAGPLISRTGRNLANRHARIRHEESRVHVVLPKLLRHITARRMFRGVQLPERPRPPTPEECCMSRCEPCVHDIFLKSLDQYHRDVVNVRQTLTMMDVPSYEWPSDIQPGGLHRSGPDVIPEERSAVENAKRALAAMESTGTQKTNYRDTLLEVGRLVLWTLRGCPG